MSEKRIKAALKKIAADPLFQKTLAAINEVGRLAEGEDRHELTSNDVDIDKLKVFERTGCLEIETISLTMTGSTFMYNGISDETAIKYLPPETGAAYLALQLADRSPSDWVGMETGTVYRILRSQNTPAIKLAMHEMASVLDREYCDNSVAKTLAADACTVEEGWSITAIYTPANAAVAENRLWRVVPEKLMAAYMDTLEKVRDKLPEAPHAAFQQSIDRIRSAIAEDRKLSTPDNPAIKAVLRSGNKSLYKL